MHVGLFIPCYIDQFYPDVGWATVEVLERQGVEPHFPQAQTCCGQPLANTGLVDEARPLAEHFLNTFRDFSHIVTPSGSCASMVRHHYHGLLPQQAVEELAAKTFELCEFLVDVLHVTRIEGQFPYQVGLHQSCHGLRELHLARSSETVGPAFNKARHLLESLEGIRFSQLERADECCGFGGTFAISEEAISCLMGLDRIRDHQQAGTQVLTANDMSCLMHLEGLLRRQRIELPVMHIAQILAGRPVTPQPAWPDTAASRLEHKQP
jgi:L-lactate dehydrogenase complex protein LldE